MLDIFKNAKDKILRKTREIVSNFRNKYAGVAKSEQTSENTTPSNTKAEKFVKTLDDSDARLSEKSLDEVSLDADDIEDSEFITEYAAHCFFDEDSEMEIAETEYEVPHNVENNDIKPSENLHSSESSSQEPEKYKIPTTKKIAEALMGATVKIKDTTLFALGKSHKVAKFFVRKFDAHIKIILFSSILGLISIGTIMIFSASSKVAMQSSNIGDAAFFVKKHLFFVGLSFIALYTAFRLKLTFFQKHWKVIAGVAFALLILVLIPGIGRNFNGARRWIRFGPIGFQPSDFAKIAVIISLSVLLVKRQHLVHRFREGFMPLFAFLGAFCAVLVVEPDFGTTLFLGTTGVFLMLIGGVRFKHLAPIVLILLPVMSLFVIMKFDHIKPRIETFINPEADPMGKGYQVRQSLIALGKGGATGVGLGNSHQSLFYLPEESTDFIYAVVGEELGFLGTSTILLLFMFVMLSGMRLAYLSDDMFAKLMATGLTTLIVFQALINMMVVTATVPNKGIALPFISFGGSLTFFYSFCIGIILRIADELQVKSALTVKENDDVKDGKKNLETSASQQKAA